MNLNLKNIQCQLGETVFEYNAEIKHSITGIFGPSGGGKSTLLNILSGVTNPDKGKITFNDKELFNASTKNSVPAHKRNIGVVFQDNYLFPHLNILQNLEYSKPYIKDRKNYVSIDKVVDLLKIEHLLTKKPAQLSGGERQRVAIGRALLSQPQLLLFDEPFSNLDRQKRKEITSYLLKINNQFKIPLIIVSHDLEDILKLTQNLLVINAGNVVAAGNYVEIVESGLAPEIIPHRRLLNVIDLTCLGFDASHKLFKFKKEVKNSQFIYTNSENLRDLNVKNQKVRVSISPDDIALATKETTDTSMQNHIPGKIVKLVEIRKSIFVTIDCGFWLIAEISLPAAEKLKLVYNKEVFCLIKSKAIEVVHVFK